MNHNLISVGAGKDKKELSRTQKDFNRLTSKILQLRQSVSDYEAATARMDRRIAAELMPLLAKYNQRRLELVMLLDRAWKSGAYKARDKKKLAKLIEQTAFDLVMHYGVEAARTYHDAYAEQDFASTEADINDEAQESLKAMLHGMYGFEFDADVKFESQDELYDYIQQQMDARAAGENADDAQPRAKRPKTAKRLEREAKKAEEEAKTSRSVREVYMDLVKTFHPDREPDDAEKLRKTELMQRITAAYRDNDLLTLLQLQLEFERIDQEHLEGIADERLKHFNKILARQAAELQARVDELMSMIILRTNMQSFATPTPQAVDYKLDRDVKALKKDIRALEKELQHLADPVTLKLFLQELEL